MLKDQDRIFLNLYNDKGSDVFHREKEATGKTQMNYVQKEKIG